MGQGNREEIVANVEEALKSSLAGLSLYWQISCTRFLVRNPTWLCQGDARQVCEVLMEPLEF